MIESIRLVVRNGQKYLYTKKLYTHKIGFRSGSNEEIVEKDAHMYLEKVAENGNILLKHKKVQDIGNGKEKCISRLDYSKNIFLFQLSV